MLIVLESLLDEPVVVTHIHVIPKTEDRLENLVQRSHEKEETMLDPLQIYAHLEAQKTVSREFGQAADMLWKESVTAESRRPRAKAWVAYWLREMADHLEPINAHTVARTRV